MRKFSTVQLARHLGVSRESIYRWMRDGKIKAAPILRKGGDVFVEVRLWTEQDVASIKKFMKENYRKGRGRKPKPKP